MHGTFFEPRNADQPGPDESYAAVWAPQWNASEVQHRVRTVDHCLAACRLGNKYGIRCLAKHQESLHGQLHPGKPFVHCAISLLGGNPEDLWMDSKNPFNHARGAKGKHGKLAHQLTLHIR